MDNENARLRAIAGALDDPTVRRGDTAPRVRLCAMCAHEIAGGDLCASCEQAEALYHAAKTCG